MTTLSLKQLMKWNSNPITEHNRKSLNINPDRIERSTRMANGRLRKYVVADKKQFSVSWDMVPKPDALTVDGKWGGDSIVNFYNTTFGSFTLELTNVDDTIETYTVVFTDFSKEVVKRGAYDVWNISVTMEEV